MLDSGDVLRLDQAHLETVVPNFGGKVLIVNGGYRGEHAILEDVCVGRTTFSVLSIALSLPEETIHAHIGGTVHTNLHIPTACASPPTIHPQINQQAFTACLKICQGPFNGKVLSAVEYEDFSKWMGPSP